MSITILTYTCDLTRAYVRLKSKIQHRHTTIAFHGDQISTTSAGCNISHNTMCLSNYPLNIPFFSLKSFKSLKCERLSSLGFTLPLFACRRLKFRFIIQLTPKTSQMSRGMCTPEDRFSRNPQATNTIQVTKKIFRQNEFVFYVLPS